MTKEQKQQLLQDMLAGKAHPGSQVQAFLVGQISKLTGQINEASQGLEQLRRQAAGVEVQCHRIAGARDEAIACLQSLLGCGVDDPPIPGPPDETVSSAVTAATEPQEMPAQQQ